MMTNVRLKNTEIIDVLIIGAGPSGLAAATQLKKLGVRRVVVLERENKAGGIPRHCGHKPFGFREFRQILTGPDYARKLVEAALKNGVEIRTSTSVVEILPDAHLTITSKNGIEQLSAKRIIYATGVRETPRAARLISGKRPLGVMNTGALQSLVYLKNRKPFERPIIVGTELVSFSAIMTCKHADIKPIAMLEENNRTTARWPTGLFPALTGIPLLLNHRLIRIEGQKTVENVTVQNNAGKQTIIDCDGVILTGKFTPEASLGRCGHLEIDKGTGGPVVDQFGRCSDPSYFACGNILRPVETAGWSWKEGVETAHRVYASLENRLPEFSGNATVKNKSEAIRFIMPQRLSFDHRLPAMQHMQIGFSRHAKGELIIRSGGKTVFQKSINKLPERRTLLAIDKIIAAAQTRQIEFDFEEKP